MSTAAPTPTPAKPHKPLNAFQRKLLEIVLEQIKPPIVAAVEAGKAKILKALAGQPLATIGTVCACINAIVVNKVPLPAKLQKAFTAGLALAGAIGVWQRVTPVTPTPIIPKGK